MFLSVLTGCTLLLAGSTVLAGCGVDGPVEETPIRVVSNPSPPSTPTGLALTAVGDDSVMVSWDAPVAGTPLVVSYQVDLDYQREANLAADVTSHTFAGVGSGQRHTATLTAIGTVDNSRTATTWILIPPDVLPTSAVPTTAEPTSSATTGPGWNSGWS